MKNAGFTLIELSIVLVIIGLIIGGVLGGQELVRAAELNATLADAQKYSTAINTFRIKYAAWPGDMKDATSYWGANAVDCTTDSSGGTCNGDGNGTIGYNVNMSTSLELFRVWQHLSLSGILPGSYSRVCRSWSGGYRYTKAGQNVPAGKIASSGWGVNGRDDYYWTSSVAGIGKKNRLYFGADGVELPYEWILKPDDARAIDLKGDDGKPKTGRILAGYGSGATYCSDTNASTAVYNGTLSTVVCTLAFDISG